MASNYASKYSAAVNIKFGNLALAMQQQVMAQAGIMSDPNELDLRENAFEGLEDFRVVVRYHDGMSRSVGVMSSDIDQLRKAIEELSWRPYDPSKPVTNIQHQYNPVQLNPQWLAHSAAAKITGITSA